MNDFSKSTPLEEWYPGSKLNSSEWPIQHTSDVLNYTTLLKYGGIFANLDVESVLKAFPILLELKIIQKISSLPALSFTHGHLVSDIKIKDIRDEFDGSVGVQYPPGVITTSLQQYCAVLKVSEMTKDKYQGFTVYPTITLNPVHWSKWRDYYIYKEPDSVLAQLNEA